MVGGKAQVFLRRLLALDDTPERVALAFSVGVFLAFSPLLGLHTILGLTIAFVFGLNRAAVLIGVFVNNPWTIVPIYTAGAYLGWFLFGTPAAPALPDMQWSHIWTTGFWRNILTNGSVVKPLLLGTTILSFLAAAASYPLALWAIRQGRAYRARRRRGFLICCLILILSPGAAAAPFPQTVEGLVNLRFQPDARIFAVMSALNLAGFDFDADNLPPNSARAMVRKRLAGINPELKQKIVGFCKSRDPETDPYQRQAKYISYALLLNGPPHFALATRPEELPPDAQSILGLETLIEDLWNSGGLEKLWDEVRPQYLAEIEAYRPLIRNLIIATLRYFHTEARVSLDRKMTFIPDLLNGRNVINARNLSFSYIVVVGPSRGEEKPLQSVRHEYLHFLIDPLLAKYVGYLPDAEPFLERVRAQPKALDRYQNNFFLMVTESLLQAVELRLEAAPPQRQTAALIELYDQGLILAPYFEEALRKFESANEAVAEVFKSFVEGIRWEAEIGRADSIDRLRSQSAEKQGKADPAADARSLAGAELRSQLSEANKLMLARQFEQAGEILEKVLRRDERNAGALFGLGQVAAQNQDLARALELYSSAVVNAGADTWIAAWAFVQRGNIFRHQELPDSAKAEWEKVLELKGDLRGAGEAARKALAALVK